MKKHHLHFIFPCMLVVLFTSCEWHGVVRKDTNIALGGRATSVDINPADNNNVWVTSESGGLYHSFNGGTLWGLVNELPQFTCNFVRVNPNDPTNIIVTCAKDTKVNNGGGIWVSFDEGHTWNQPPSSIPKMQDGTPLRTSAYGISFVRNTSYVYVGTDYGVALSPDGGLTWQYLHQPPDGSMDVVYSVLGVSIGKVLSFGVNGIRITAAGFGGGWIQNQDKTQVAGGANIPNAFAAVPQNANRLFLAQGNDNLYYSLDGGYNWKSIPTKFIAQPGAYVQSRHPYVKITNSNDKGFDLYFASYSVVAKMPVTWNATLQDYDFSAPWIFLPFQHSDPSDLAFGSAGNSLLFATNDGGVEKSTDRGRSWTQVGNPNNNFDALQIYSAKAVLAPNFTANDLYFGTQDNHLYSSNDNGTTWSGPFENEGGYFQGPVSKPTAGDYFITFFHATNSNGEAWSRTNANYSNETTLGLPDYSTGINFVNEHTFMTVATDAPQNLMVSTDAGLTWNSVLPLNQHIYSHPAISGNAANPSVFIPFTNSVINGLLRVDNAFNGVAGDEVVSTVALPANGSLDAVSPNVLEWYVPFGVDPNDPNFLIIPDSKNEGIFISADGGVTWQLNDQLTKLITGYGTYYFDVAYPYAQVRIISFDPQNSNHILVGTTQAGIFYSADHGSTWAKIPGSDEIPNVSSFVFLQTTDPQEVIASSYGRGLWDMSLDIPANVKRWPEPPPGGSNGPAPEERRNDTAPPAPTLKPVPVNSLRHWQIPGDKKAADALYYDTTSPVLILRSVDRHRGSAETIAQSSPLVLTGKRWDPKAPLNFSLDGQKWTVPKVEQTGNGSFTIKLPPFNESGTHKLMVTQQSSHGEKRSTIYFNVIPGE